MSILIGNQINASPIALGCMRLTRLDTTEAEKLLLTAVELGINFFDHADIYAGGQAETLFGQLLRRNPGLRDQITIQTKCGICPGYYDSSEKHILEAVDGSLSRLGLDSVDVLLIHRPDALMEPEEIASAFSKLEKAGKVKYFGVSNMNSVQMQLLDREMPGRLIINQLQFGVAHSGLVDEGIAVNTGLDQGVVRTDGVLDYCRLHGVTVQAWSPMQYGMFKGPFMQCEDYAELNAYMDELAQQYGVSAEAIALAWILRHPAKIQAIIGTANIGRVRRSAEAMKVTLTRPEWYKMYRLAGNVIP